MLSGLLVANYQMIEYSAGLKLKYPKNPICTTITQTVEHQLFIFSMSIHYFLILNRQGKIRLAKWFDNTFMDSDKKEIVEDVHRLVSLRDLKYQSNFVEFRGNKLVYRRYAGLFFIMLVDYDDNELSYLESVHFFVEILDTYFDNVCELDLVFNFYKLYQILDEIYLGGELLEILKQKVVSRLTQLDELAT